MLTKRKLIERARANRKNMPVPERIIWSRVRKRQLGGYKFRRQHVMYPFIVDFYCASEKLVVELDGKAHARPEHLAADARRDEVLRDEFEVRVVRFWNWEVLFDLDGVLGEILELLG